ncbi:hypothetical protein CAOG_009940 [Capsaspora owczarzaki ATCC 30864]|uniref:Uncharacterized protein n=1 Tax=Capsaspora owczarzaki (strain ATCC 30864) TaxID=595528 RepID=A0A0D2X479_CAPO3|nr:hypothetical protein CAOG_009940 [Capsaspora owczarzaki ATCC 30864]
MYVGVQFLANFDRQAPAEGVNPGDSRFHPTATMGFCGFSAGVDLGVRYFMLRYTNPRWAIVSTKPNNAQLRFQQGAHL